MAVLPQFTPAQAPGTEAELSVQSQNAQQSWMTQAAQRENLQAEAGLTQARANQIQTLLPALAAKANAEATIFDGQAQSARVQQEFEGKAGAVISQATKELTDALQIADPAGKSDAMRELQAKYGWLGQTTAGKSLSQTIDNSRVNADQEHFQDMNHETAITEKEMQLQMMRELYTTRANATMYSADQRLQGQLGTQDLRNQGNLAVQDDRNKGNLAAKQAGPNTPENLNAFLDVAQSYEDQALQATDPAQSAQLLQRANLFRQKAQSIANPRGDLMMPQPGTPGTPQASTPAPGSAGRLSIAQNMSPALKLQALQQALNQGAITLEQAKAALVQMGYKIKPAASSAAAAATTPQVSFTPPANVTAAAAGQ